LREEEWSIKPLLSMQSAASVQSATLSQGPERVLGVVYRGEHAVAVGVQGVAVWLHQPGEGALIAGAGRLQQLVLVHAIHPTKDAGPWLPEGNLAAEGVGDDYIIGPSA
jgi:hypothetical protein